MDTEKYSNGSCPVARGLCHVGDAWSMLILRDAGGGATRFDQFQKNLGIAPNILTRRLTALVEGGLLERHRYSEHPPRDEYLLTDSGRDFLPVLFAFGAWGARHFGDAPVSHLVENGSGASVEAVVVARATGTPLSDLDLRVVQPGA